MRAYRVVRPHPNEDLQRKIAWTAAMLVPAEPTAARIGVTPSAIVAQAALECGWGDRAIGNNLFGIKVSRGWNGQRQLVRTREVIDGRAVMVDAWFRAYDSYEDSIEDHFQFLRRNSRYAEAGVFDPDDTKSDREYFEALKRAGYATDPRYVELLVDVQATVLMFMQRMELVTDAAPGPVPGLDRLLIAGCANGPDIAALQALLLQPTTGAYDAATIAAVRAFQAGNPPLLVDGIVGPMTWAVLHAVKR